MIKRGATWPTGASSFPVPARAPFGDSLVWQTSKLQKPRFRAPMIAGCSMPFSQGGSWPVAAVLNMIMPPPRRGTGPVALRSTGRPAGPHDDARQRQATGGRVRPDRDGRTKVLAGCDSQSSGPYHAAWGVLAAAALHGAFTCLAASRRRAATPDLAGSARANGGTGHMPHTGGNDGASASEFPVPRGPMECTCPPAACSTWSHSIPSE